MNNQNEIKVAIVGIGFRLPSGNDIKSNQSPSQLTDNLMNGFNGLVNIGNRWNENFNTQLNDITSKNAGLLPLDEWKSFDPIFFGINPTDTSILDPQQRMLLKCTYEAIQDAFIDPSTLRCTNTSTFIGCSSTDYKQVQNSITGFNKNYFASSLHTLSNSISYYFDFRSKSMTIDSACSSSSSAIIMGYESIKNGTSNVSICGGVNMLLDVSIIKSFSYLNLLSKNQGRCMTFDENADGYVRSEGAGIVVLKNLDQAIKDGNNIYCELIGSSLNVDGNGLNDKLNFYSPSSSSQAENIKLALDSTNGQIKESDIDYCECHGTGTPSGDPIECEGISMVFKDSFTNDNPLLIGSIKSNIGHLEACSGIASLIKCALMYKMKCFFPNINFNNPNPSIKFNEWHLKVVTEPIKFNPNKDITMIINNFGVTGSNSCIVLKQFNNDNNNNNSSTMINKNYLIPFSSNSVKSNQNYISSIILKDNNQFNNFLIRQIYTKSLSHYQRSVIIANDYNQFNNKSIQYNTTNNKSSNLSIKYNKPTIVFIMCGQGSQYNRMAQVLYNNERVFRDTVDLIDSKLSSYYGYSVLEKLRSIKDDDLVSINQQIIVQPSNVMIQVALFELYKHWGVNPSFIIGHSLGEVTTAYCSGMIDLDTLCYVVYNRSTLQQTTQGTGKMLSINISYQEFIDSYSNRYPLIEVACYNSPSSIVLAGNENQLIEILNDAKSKGIFTTMLGSLTPIHTSIQMMVKDEFLKLQFNSNEPKIPTFSTVTSKLFNYSTHRFNSEYLFNNILKPVLFQQTIKSLYQHIEENQLNPNISFIELSPHPTLIYYLKQMIPKDSTYFKNGDSISIYSSLNKKSNDLYEFQKTIAQLYCNGYNEINFKCQFNNKELQHQNIQINNESFNLPLYQWDEKEYWSEYSLHQEYREQGPPIDHLGYSNSNYSPFNKSYETIINIEKLPFQYLKGHQVKGRFYFPGVGYVINILSIYQNQDITISFIEFKTPLIFIEGVNSVLQTNIHQTGKSEYRVLNHFKDKSNQWILSSTGNFQLFNHSSSDNSSGSSNLKLNIQQILNNNCNKAVIKQEEFYEYIKMKTGLQYSGSFQGVKECYLGTDCSLSIVSLESPTNENSSSSLFNTSVLDSCLHGLIVLVKDKCQLVLDKLEGIKYYSNNVPKDRSSYSSVYVYSNLIKQNGNSYFGSITIMLNDGTVLIDIDQVTCTSLIQIKDSLVIEQPINQIYSTYLQLKDSVIPSPSTFKSLFNNSQQNSSKRIQEMNINYSNSLKFIIKNYLKYIGNRNSEININLIKSLTIDQLKERYLINNKYQRLFKSVFGIIKSYYNQDQQKQLQAQQQQQEEEEEDITTIEHQELILKSIRITSKLLFPLNDDDPSVDLPQSLLEGTLLDDYYDSDYFSSKNELIGDIITQSLKSNLKERMIFKILEFGGGKCSLSKVVLNKIHQLLKDNPDYEIDIEYTWSDISTTFIHDAMNHLSNIRGVNLIYKSLNLEEDLISTQQLRPTYYDFIIMSNVIHVVKDIQFGLNQLYNLLSTNGQLLLVEPPVGSSVVDCIFGNFEQWWSFNDSHRIDRCYLNKSQWLKLLQQQQVNQFKSDILISDDSKYYSLTIQVQKESINNIKLITTTDNSSNNETIIIYSNSNNQFINNIKSLYQLNNNIIIISTINQFNKLIESNIINNSTIIYFIKSMEQIKLDNFKQITMEYIEINQILLKFKLNTTKHVLITVNNETINYLSSSIIGASRYFDEFSTTNQLCLFTLNYDNESVNNQESISIIPTLINNQFSIQREFIIKSNKVYYERFKNETNLNKDFKSTSFIDINNKNKELLLAKLSSNLEYQLKAKQTKLKANQVEVKVNSFGINYKDFLVYTGNVIGELVNLTTGESNDPELCNDFSGTITRIGDGSDIDKYKFKIGDQVYGIGNNTSSSHIIVNIDSIYYKPNNLSHSQASALPSIYITSYYSIYTIGNLKQDESILIHSGSGGIGLSTLNLLKWKNHRGHIFVTVGSKHKEDYLKRVYGDFITGIYSTRDKSYYSNIKLKLKELHSNKTGIDLILNTLSGDFMDSNFKCLSIGGRICDLSITHLNNNEFTNNNLFKYNVGYHQIELLFLNNNILRSILKTITEAIESKELINQLPLIEYSNTQVKDAIEFINQRKHIGKIIVNNYQDIIQHLIQNQDTIKQDPILKNDYEINGLGETILLTGQSGIILDILNWIIKYSKSVKNIIIISKSKLKWNLQFIINCFKDKFNFYFKSCDISNYGLLEDTINKVMVNSNIQNIDSIFHFAFEQVSCEVYEINMDHMNISHNAKTLGAIHLHELSIKYKWNIRNFVLASSMASLLGSTKQCSYVSANCVIDSLSIYRRSIGLPSTCINFGMLESSGFAARNESIQNLLDGQGFNNVSINTVLGSLDVLIQNQQHQLSTNLLISSFNFNNIINNPGTMYYKFDYQLNSINQNNNNQNKNGGDGDISQLILNKLSELLSIDESKINQDLKLNSLGADSLTIVSLKNWIDKEIYINIITIQQLQNNTIQSIINLIKNELNKKQLDNNNNNNISNSSSSSSNLNNNSINNNNSIDSKLKYWENEIKLDSSIIELINNNKFNLNSSGSSNSSSSNNIILNEINLFLTGTTGFLGAYILSKCLLLSNIKSVYCLVRNKNNQINQLDQVINNLKNHLLYEQLNQDQLNKIKIIVGDLSINQFGLNNDQFKLLSNNINLIINSGADINLLSDYQTIKNVNVNGLKEIIKLSLSSSNQLIPIVNLSTYSVFMKQEFNGDDFDEQTYGLVPLENLDLLPSGYMQSKIIGEHILYSVSKQIKIPYIIIRSPSIFSNPITGIGHNADFGQLFLQSCVALGYYPDLSLGCLVSPITWCVNNFMGLIFNESYWSTRNLNSNSNLNVYNVNGNVVDILDLVNGFSKRIEFNDWKRLVNGSNEKCCIKLRTFHTLDYYRYNLTNSFNLSKRTKQILINNGTYDNGGIVTNQMIINLLNYNKIKINQNN